MRDKGELPSGRKIAGKAHVLHRRRRRADRSAGRLGAEEPQGQDRRRREFAQTQFCMDAGVVRRYVARLAEDGVKLPILIGVAPLRSAKSARWMREQLFGTIIPDAMIERLEEASDPAAEGRRSASN